MSHDQLLKMTHHMTHEPAGFNFGPCRVCLHKYPCHHSSQCHTIIFFTSSYNLLASSLTFQNWTIKCHKLYITRIPFLTSIQPSMSCLSHITLSLAIPLPFPQLVACPQHPKPGHGSPNFCRHPLIFLLLSVVKIPGLRRSLVAEQSIGRNWPHFEWGFSACSHPFLTKWISRLQLPRWWLSRDMFGSAGRC